MGWRLAAIAGVTLAAAGLLFWLATQATKTPMGLLFTDLDARDSAAVVERLEAANIPYELKGDGSTILVPQDRGYLYKDGEILSPDGKCRAFDADSKGTIWIGHVGEAYALRAGLWVNPATRKGFAQYVTMVPAETPVGHCLEACP